MSCTRSTALFVFCFLFVASGCQHAPPRPLDFGETASSLRARDVNVAPVQAFAEALCTAADAAPAAFNPADGLSLTEGAAVALWFNADLRVARLEAARAAGAASNAGRWPDPELGIELGQKSVEGEPGGFLRDAGGVARDWISAASLGITIPLSGRPGAERRFAGAAGRAAAWRAAEAEWNTLAQVQMGWAAWSAAHARVALLDEHLALLGQFGETAQALAEAGETTPSGARLFAVERMRREAERARAQRAEAELHMALLQLLGLLPDAPVQLLPSLGTPLIDDGEPANLERHPTLLRLAAEYEAAEARLRLELRRQYPDVTLSPTFSDEHDETSLRVGLGIPLLAWNANRSGIADALGAREVARAQADAGYARLVSEASQARVALAGSRAQRAQLVAEAVPAVDAQMDESLALLRAGEIDIVLIYEALGQAFAVKEELLEAVLAESLAAARLSAALAEDRVLDTQMEPDHE